MERVGNSCFVYVPLPSDPLEDMRDQILDQVDVEVDKIYDPDKFHITLLYIEDCGLSEISELVSQFMPPIQFSVELASLEVFDEGEVPVLVWKVNPDPALLRLQSDLYFRAENQNLPISPFSKPEVYKPHVTVAYLKGVPRDVPSITPFKIAVDKFKVGRDDYNVLFTVHLPTGRGERFFIEAHPESNGHTEITQSELKSILSGERIVHGPQRRILSLDDGPFSLRHGKHSGQEGVEGQQGGSAPGFTHNGTDGKVWSESLKSKVMEFIHKSREIVEPSTIGGKFKAATILPDGRVALSGDAHENLRKSIFKEFGEEEFPGDQAKFGLIDSAEFKAQGFVRTNLIMQTNSGTPLVYFELDPDAITGPVRQAMRDIYWAAFKPDIGPPNVAIDWEDSDGTWHSIGTSGVGGDVVTLEQINRELGFKIDRSLIDRHGTHVGQEGVQGQQGGSAEGFTHGDKGDPNPPMAGETVDGRTVRNNVPNEDSIPASLFDWDELPGIREVKLSDFETGLEEPFFATEGRRKAAERLAKKIRENNWIEPLIVVYDAQSAKVGPYILEGSTRFDALRIIGAKAFPALVVIDRDPKTGIVERHGTHQGQEGVQGQQESEDLMKADPGGSGERLNNKLIPGRKLFNREYFETLEVRQPYEEGDIAKLMGEVYEWPTAATILLDEALYWPDPDKLEAQREESEYRERVLMSVESRMIQEGLDQLYDTEISTLARDMPDDVLIQLDNLAIEDLVRDLVFMRMAPLTEEEIDAEIDRAIDKARRGPIDAGYIIGKTEIGEIATFARTRSREQVPRINEGGDAGSWLELRYLVVKQFGKGFGAQMMGEVFQLASENSSGLYAGYNENSLAFFKEFGATIDEEKEIAFWIDDEVKILAERATEESIVVRETLDEVDIGGRGIQKEEVDLEPNTGVFADIVDWASIPRNWIYKIARESEMFISPEDQAVFDARKRGERKQRGAEEDQFLSDVLGKRSLQSEIADLFARLSTVFRHGKHEGQEGREGQQGGSAPGFKHGDSNTWIFKEDLPSGLKKAAQKGFRPISQSAAHNLGDEHDWRNLSNSEWFAGLKIGEVSAIDQFGDSLTWSVVLWEAGGIMMDVEGASRWQIIATVIDKSIERHGDHVGQEGRPPEQGGSKPGFTHNGAGGDGTDGGEGKISEPIFHGTGAEAAKSIMETGLQVNFADDNNNVSDVIYAASDRRDAMFFAGRSSEKEYALITIDSSLAGSRPATSDRGELMFSKDIPSESIVRVEIYRRGFQRKDDQLIKTIERSGEKPLQLFVLAEITESGEYSILGPEKDQESEEE